MIGLTVYVIKFESKVTKEGRNYEFLREVDITTA